MNPDLAADHQAALKVACPFCAEPAGRPCTRPDNGGGRARLSAFPAHEARIRAAGIVHAPIDPRDLREHHTRPWHPPSPRTTRPDPP